MCILGAVATGAAPAEPIPAVVTAPAAAAAGPIPISPDLAEHAAYVAERKARAARPDDPAPAASVAVPTARARAADAHPARPTPRTVRKARPRSAAALPAAPPAAAGGAEAAVAYALAQVGKPYRWATAGPNGFDCSGLVRASYIRAGLNLPHQTGALAARGRPVARADLRRGDLVFPHAGHVGIYLGGGLMVHAPKPGDRVKVAPVYRFGFARRVT